MMLSLFSVFIQMLNGSNVYFPNGLFVYLYVKECVLICQGGAEIIFDRNFIECFLTESRF